jgi:porin
MLGWQGALLHVNAYQIHGQGLPAAEVGNLLTIGNIQATPATRLFGLWLQQSLFNDQVSLRFGQIAADDEFFVSQYASLFLNSAFGWPSILGVNLPSGGAAYPLAAPGARLRVAFSPTLAVSTAIISGDPAPAGTGDSQRRDGDGLRFRIANSALWINEIAYADIVGEEALPGTLKLGAWYHNGDFPDYRRDIAGLSLADPTAGAPLMHRADFGGYVIWDQLLWRNGAGDQGLAGFLRLGGAPGDRNLIMLHADGGISYVGLFTNRPDDVTGLAFSYEAVGSSARALGRDAATLAGTMRPAPDYESAVELSYQALLAPWWMVQPDAQLILHPGARLGVRASAADTWVLGLRTAVSF